MTLIRNHTELYNNDHLTLHFNRLLITFHHLPVNSTAIKRKISINNVQMCPNTTISTTTYISKVMITCKLYLYADIPSENHTLHTVSPQNGNGDNWIKILRWKPLNYLDKFDFSRWYATRILKSKNRCKMKTSSSRIGQNYIDSWKLLREVNCCYR